MESNNEERFWEAPNYRKLSIFARVFLEYLAGFLSEIKLEGTNYWVRTDGINSAIFDQGAKDARTVGEACFNLPPASRYKIATNITSSYVRKPYFSFMQTEENALALEELTASLSFPYGKANMPESLNKRNIPEMEEVKSDDGALENYDLGNLDDYLGGILKNNSGEES